MNCRRVSNLLSAYMDAELAGAEMLEIRAHLDRCPTCLSEYESLLHTKRLLGSLALRMPRTDFETTLTASAERAAHPVMRWMPSWLAAWRDGIVAPVRPRPVVTALALSVAGLLLATVRLETSQEVRRATPVAYPRYEVYPTYVGQLSVRQHAPPLSDPSPLRWNRNRARTAENRNSPYLLTVHAK